MRFDKEIVALKLRRWEKYLYNNPLPYWDDIPNVGLYMEQAVGILKEYLDFLPPEISGDSPITAAAINNCVRLKLMPGTVNRKYYRVHLAYLVAIFSLRQALGVATVKKIVPTDVSEEEFKAFYDHYVDLYSEQSLLFIDSVRKLGEPILKKEENAEEVTEDLILRSGIMAGFATLLAEKMLVLDGLDQSMPGIDLTVPTRRPRVRRRGTEALGGEAPHEEASEAAPPAKPEEKMTRAEKRAEKKRKKQEQ